MKAVILFDIDGTLVDCGGVGRRSMERAFEEIHGLTDACASIVFGGMTDRAIIRQACEAVGIPATPSAIDHIIDEYLRILERTLPAAAAFRELRGARELALLSRRCGHAVGLGTGNVRAGARLKLQRAALWDLFDFGGFGCDAEERDVLLQKGRTRGAQVLGIEGAVVTLVVGDTPRDVHAAHAIEARCLAVATGRFSRADLERAGADIIVDSLADPLAEQTILELSSS